MNIWDLLRNENAWRAFEAIYKNPLMGTGELRQKINYHGTGFWYQIKMLREFGMIIKTTKRDGFRFVSGWELTEKGRWLYHSIIKFQGELNNVR